MAQIDSRYLNKRLAGETDQLKQDRSSLTRKWWFWFIMGLLFFEIIMPIILWKTRAPTILDDFKEIPAALIVGITVAFMLVHDRFPKAVLLILGITIIWGSIALLGGQTMAATAWGWWRLFKYPALMIFAYLIPDWPIDFPRQFIRFLIVLLAFQVLVQIVQYALGQPPGDSLAGTFGDFGVGAYTNFIFLVVCIGMGYWAITGDLKSLLLILGLGLAASTMSSTKFYVVSVVLLGIAALFLHLLRRGRVRQILLYVTIVLLTTSIFVTAFNSVVVARNDSRLLQEYLDEDNLNEYLFHGPQSEQRRITNYGQFHLSRGQSVVYGWEQIHYDTTTLLFGFGIGSRIAMNNINVYGISALEDIYSNPSITNLGSWLMEYGLIGLLTFFLINLWVIVKLFRHARNNPDQNLAALEYGLILFTLFWPVWLFYHKPWTFGGMMTLYYVSLGYVFQMIYKPQTRFMRPKIEGHPSLKSTAVPRD